VVEQAAKQIGIERIGAHAQRLEKVKRDLSRVSEYEKSSRLELRPICLDHRVKLGLISFAAAKQALKLLGVCRK
jgi:hypothetical protein